MEDVLAKLVDEARRRGASYAEARFQEVSNTTITVENGSLKTYESDTLRGVGVRVLLDGSWGYCSTNQLRPSQLREIVTRAIRIARSSRRRGLEAKVGTEKAIRDKARVQTRLMSDEVPAEDKIRIGIEANKASMISPAIKNATTRIGTFTDRRLLHNSEGSSIDVQSSMAGLHQLSVAFSAGSMESVSDGESKCAGFEFIQERDWGRFCREISELAVKAVGAHAPAPGTSEVIADPDLIGLILHEAFGHASEGDLVASRESVLQGRICKALAGPEVTIYDQGVIEGGYFVPYDDEGTPKSLTTVVENGVLRGYLHSRQTAVEMQADPTGNARAMSFDSQPIVRQTNYYLRPRDYSLEELAEDIDHGYYVKGRGAMGGQVDVAGGTFTFSVGPSFRIEKGEIKEMVRGTTLSGMVLEALQTIDAVGKDLVISTNVFGGCGKGMQMVKVGAGGPHTRIRRIILGGHT
jgi:TldD protein